jgi:CRISPR-associated endoribonuclease Cas6
MRFKLKLLAKSKEAILPINYQYPLSAAIYKILAKGDANYADFLHEKGYGKGYKFFTFSDLEFKFRREGDRILLLDPRVAVVVRFHLPEASRVFVEGLFKSEEIVIADKKSKVVLLVESIISLNNPLKEMDERGMQQILVKPSSMIISGEKKEDGKYGFLSPDDLRFGDALLYNWQNKIEVCYGKEAADEAILMIEVEKYNQPFRSRLVTIKADTDEETQIRGYLNFKLKLTAERRYLDLILNAGLGLYSAQGMGCLEVIEERINKNNK